MPRVVYDPSASSIVVDLLLEAADGRSSLLIPVVLDTGASSTEFESSLKATCSLPSWKIANPNFKFSCLTLDSAEG